MSEVQASVDKGCVARWADASVHPKPHAVLPFGLDPKKPRLIWDARWLHLMCRHLSCTIIDGVGNVTQCAWTGAHQVVIDHEAGYRHAALSANS